MQVGRENPPKAAPPPTFDSATVAQLIASLGNIDPATLAAAPDTWHQILNVLAASTQYQHLSRSPPVPTQLPHPVAPAPQRHSNGCTSAVAETSTCAAPTSAPSAATPPTSAAVAPCPASPPSKRGNPPPAAGSAGVHDLAQLLTARTASAVQCPPARPAAPASCIRPIACSLTPQRLIPVRQPQRPVAPALVSQPPRSPPPAEPRADPAPASMAQDRDEPPAAEPSSGGAAASRPGTAAGAMNASRAASRVNAAPVPEMVCISAQPLLAAVAAAAAEEAAEPPSPTAAAGIAQSKRAMFKSSLGHSSEARFRAKAAGPAADAAAAGPAGDAPAAAPTGTDSPTATNVGSPAKSRACASAQVAAAASSDHNITGAGRALWAPPKPSDTQTLSAPAPAAASDGPMHAVEEDVIEEHAAEGGDGTPESGAVPEAMWRFAEAWRGPGHSVARSRLCPVDADAAKRHVLEVYFRNEQSAKDKVCRGPPSAVPALFHTEHTRFSGYPCVNIDSEHRFRASISAAEAPLLCPSSHARQHHAPPKCFPAPQADLLICNALQLVRCGRVVCTPGLGESFPVGHGIDGGTASTPPRPRSSSNRMCHQRFVARAARSEVSGLLPMSVQSSFGMVGVLARAPSCVLRCPMPVPHAWLIWHMGSVRSLLRAVAESAAGHRKPV